MAQVQESNKEVSEDQVVYLSIGIVLVVVISTVVIYGIGLAQNQQASSYQNKIAGVEEEIAQLAEVEEKATALGIQEGKLNFLYASQAKWSDLVADLGSKCVKGVRFSQVAVDQTQNQATFEGFANSFIQLNQQVVALQQSNFFQAIDLSNATIDDQGKVQFYLIAKLAE